MSLDMSRVNTCTPTNCSPIGHRIPHSRNQIEEVHCKCMQDQEVRVMRCVVVLEIFDEGYSCFHLDDLQSLDHFLVLISMN